MNISNQRKINLKMKPINIYIDHWEDYESIGDRAMLLNAMRRLQEQLGSCQFVGPSSPNKAGEFEYPDYKLIPAPHLEITKHAGRLRRLFSKFIRLFPSNLKPKITSKYFLDAAIVIVSAKHFFYKIGFRFVFNDSFRSFLEEIERCDVFFTVGDCSLSDYWLEGVVLKSWLVKFVRPYVSVSVMSSQGIGPLETPWARKRLVNALQTLDILSFRDFSYSKELVETEGLQGVPYKIVGDEAFSFPVADQKEITSVLRKTGISEDEPFIVVNFRHTDFTQNTTPILNKIADFLDKVIETTNKKILFICMSKGENYGRDFAAGKLIKSLVKRTEDYLLLEPIDDISLDKGLIGAADYSIGLSYHLHVFSLSQGHPTLILYTGEYYRTKSEGLISFYKPPCRALNFSEISIEQALAYVLEIEKNYDKACNDVGVVNQEILKKNDWTIQKLEDILSEKNLIGLGEKN